LKYAVLADVHANLTALNSVLEDADNNGVEVYCCVGDMIGYGAEPVECIARLRSLTSDFVAGNHDVAAAGLTDLRFFNSDAYDSVVWTRDQLTPAHLRFVSKLPLVAEIEGAVLVHGSLHVPDAFHYILSAEDALATFSLMEHSLCFVGHSHVPGIFCLDGQLSYVRDEVLELGDEMKTIVNVGSVGQPRDDDRRASYVIYDSQARTVTTRRVEYDWEEASRKILEAGLPEMNAYLLSMGQ